MFLRSISILLALIFFPTLCFADRVLSADGRNGRDGQRGINYSGRAPDGYMGYNGGRGGDGQNGRNGGDATQASAGENAGKIILTLERHASKPEVLVWNATINGKTLPSEEFPISSGFIYLLARGGNGGNGAEGGNGQDGGYGGRGGEAGPYNRNSGDGGRGGDGGKAGESTNGANGGNGGTILLLLPEGQMELSKYVKANISPGEGGKAPSFLPRAGRGGEGGEPGNACFFNNGNYECGFQGMRGSSGRDGSPVFSHPQNGWNGQYGQYEIQEKK